MKLYLAGPLFTAAEREFNERLRTELEIAGHDVWLPQEREPRDKTAAAIFAMDVAGIEWASVVVACMDGPDPDSGTCFECGYAYAGRKPIVVWRSDFRSAADAPDSLFNLMLTASANVVLNLPLKRVHEIAEAICGALQQINVDSRHHRG